jgi:acetylornithine deacetylase/succinyl-diaminopimelate desuccinylase-like protein
MSDLDLIIGDRAAATDTSEDRLVTILSDLIAIPTAYPPGDTTAICALVAPRLTALGYDVQVIFEVDGLANLVASIGDGAPGLLFNAHADTVGPGDTSKSARDPFTAEVRDGRVYGLGAANCKGSMAVQLWLAEEIARRGGPAQGQVTFAFVTDEECIGPHGTDFLRRAGHVKPDMLVVGAPTENAVITRERGVIWVAPTENAVITRERGVIWVEITTEGRAAHAGEAHLGDNAILRMSRIVSALDARLAPRLARRRDGELRSTLNIGRIVGGHNTNVVPSHCTLEIDRNRPAPADLRDRGRRLRRDPRPGRRPWRAAGVIPGPPAARHQRL